MKVIEPKAVLYWNDDPLKHLEYCGRVCYNSYDKVKDGSAVAFLSKIIQRKHYGVLEHAAVNINKVPLHLDLVDETDPEFGLLMARANLGSLRYSDFLKYDSNYENVEPDKALKALAELPRAVDILTFEVTASRSCTHQFVRHRNMSFCERSLRYVKLNKLEDFEVITDLAKDWRMERHIEESWEGYKEALDEGYNPDEARALLPMCTATKLIATAQATWWLEFLKLRLHTAASNEIIKIADQIYQQCPEQLKVKAAELGLNEQFEKAREKCGIKQIS